MSLFGKTPKAPRGEPLVWFTGLGLALALLMVAGLLALVIANGFSVFWPKRVALLTLRPEAAVANVGAVLAGETAGERTIHGAGKGDERLLFLGNKDTYGQAFAYVAESAILREEFPAALMAAERVEYGNAYFIPVALRLADGASIPADDARFAPSLDRLIDEAAGRRDALMDIERVKIGAINRRQQEIKRAPGGGEPAEKAALDAEYATLSARAATLRAEQARATLLARTADGRELALPVGSLIGVWKPNELGFAGRLSLGLGRVWHFISAEPREANTEGGVFPAIFGTLVMTVFMSALVTPFGVLAAIYLREYATQGLFVRWVRISVNNLAGVPSIVFGIFGLGFFVYGLGGSIDRIFFPAAHAAHEPVFGTGGLLWAALTLALMTLPVVIVATEEALASVPRGIREASLALGASKWQTIREVVLPAGAPGVLTGVILAMARGAGEVAPLMMVGVVKLAPSLPLDGEAPFLHLDRKFMHLGFHIFDIGFQSPDSDAARPMVFATTLLLIVIIVLLNLGAISLRNRLRAKYKTGAF